ESALRMLRKGGIAVQATVILGLPGETDRAMRRTLQWLEGLLGDNRHDLVSPCFFVPFTPDVEAAMQQRSPFRIEVQDMDCYTGHIPETPSNAFSFDDQNRLYEDMAPTRRGQFARIAHLATTDDVRDRLGKQAESAGEVGARW